MTTVGNNSAIDYSFGPVMPAALMAQRSVIDPKVKEAVDKVLDAWGTSNSKGSGQRVIRDFTDLADSVPEDPSKASDQERLGYAMKVLEGFDKASPYFSKKAFGSWESAVLPFTKAYEPASKMYSEWVPDYIQTDESGSPSQGPVNYSRWAEIAPQLGFKGQLFEAAYDSEGGGMQGGPTPELRQFVDQKRAEGYDFVAKRSNIHNYNNMYGFKLPSGEIVGQHKTGDDDDIKSFLTEFVLPVATTVIGLPGYGGQAVQSLGASILPSGAAEAISGIIGISPDAVASAVGRGVINAGIKGIIGGDTEDILRAGITPLATPVISELVGNTLDAFSPPDAALGLQEGMVPGALDRPIQDAIQRSITTGLASELAGGDFKTTALPALANVAAKELVSSDLGALEKPLERAITSAVGAAVSGGSAEDAAERALIGSVLGTAAGQAGEQVGMSPGTSTAILNAVLSGGDPGSVINAFTEAVQDIKPEKVGKDVDAAAEERFTSEADPIDALTGGEGDIFGGDFAAERTIEDLAEELLNINPPVTLPTESAEPDLPGYVQDLGGNFLDQEGMPITGNLEQDFVVEQNPMGPVIRDTAGNVGYFDDTGNWTPVTGEDPTELERILTEDTVTGGAGATAGGGGAGGGAGGGGAGGAQAQQPDVFGLMALLGMLDQQKQQPQQPGLANVMPGLQMSPFGLPFGGRYG